MPPFTQNVESTLNRRSLPFAFFAVALTVLSFYIIWVAQSVIVPLMTAIFLSFLVTSLKQAIGRVPMIGAKLPEPLAFILAFALIATTLFTLALLVGENFKAILQKAPEYQLRFATLAENLLIWAEGISWMPEEVISSLAGIVEGIGGGLMGADPGASPDDLSKELLTDDLSISADQAREALRRQAFSAVQSVVGGLTSAATGLLGSAVTIFLYTAFILLERGRLISKVGKIAAEAGRADFVDEVLGDIAKLVRSYISIKTLISLFVASLSFVIMSLLGTDFAGFWALIIFAFGFIPIVGAIIAITLPTLLTLVQPDGGLVNALVTLVALTAAEQAVSSFIEPRLLGKSLNLSPLIILLSLATWGALWGFAGMILCVPMTVGLLIILSQFDVTRPVAIMLSDRGDIAPLCDPDMKADVAEVEA